MKPSRQICFLSQNGERRVQPILLDAISASNFLNIPWIEKNEAKSSVLTIIFSHIQNENLFIWDDKILTLSELGNKLSQYTEHLRWYRNVSSSENTAGCTSSPSRQILEIIRLRAGGEFQPIIYTEGNSLDPNTTSHWRNIWRNKPNICLEYCKRKSTWIGGSYCDQVGASVYREDLKSYTGAIWSEIEKYI